MIKKFIMALTAFVMSINIVSAKHIPSVIDKVFLDTDISKSAVGISIQNIDKPRKFYELNYEKPMMPASSQKLITTIPSIKILGENYKFSTKLYKEKNKQEYYLVLGADPYLTTRELKLLLSNIKLPKDKNISKIYIDDSIFDKTEWGEGWQWDDDLNPLIPKYSAYNIDGNLIKITFTPLNNQPPQVETNVFYPIVFMNYVKNGNKNDIKLSRKNYISSNEITLDGEILSKTSVNVPINNMELYFKLRIKDSLKANKLHYYDDFTFKKLPTKNIELIGEITHPIDKAIFDIYENSNNLVAETVFKLAGAKYSNSKGSFEHSYQIIEDFCSANVVDLSTVRIVDGSGVSKNNLLTPKFMTDYLVQLVNNYGYDEVSKMLASPNNEYGTLKNRMLFLQNNLHAKTGTLFDVSSISGFIETRKGNKYAFSIIINDAKSTKIQKKSFEEVLLREIYRNL